MSTDDLRWRRQHHRERSSLREMTMTIVGCRWPRTN